MKKYVNGNYIELTIDEITDLQSAWEQVMSEIPAPEPTAEERIAALEEQLAAAKILLGLEE